MFYYLTILSVFLGLNSYASNIYDVNCKLEVGYSSGRVRTSPPSHYTISNLGATRIGIQSEVSYFYDAGVRTYTAYISSNEKGQLEYLIRFHEDYGQTITLPVGYSSLPEAGKPVVFEYKGTVGPATNLKATCFLKN